MIAFVSGTVYGYGSDYVIIETKGGVGYEVFFNHSKPIALGDEIRLFTYEQIREDAFTLYGFLSNEELELFKKLITVKGLGCKTALTILSKNDYGKTINAIEKGDIGFFKAISGIGAKTASQVILDLKGKLITQSVDTNQDLFDALEAFKSLGYRNSEISAITKNLSEANCSSVDEYIKVGLQLLNKFKGAI